MNTRSDPRHFSITAFMTDQVADVAACERLSPGEAVVRLRSMADDPAGRRRLMAIMRDATRGETHFIVDDKEKIRSAMQQASVQLGKLSL